MNPATANLVEMKGISLSFDEKVILNSVNLAVPPHEVTVILGLSGSGKSTILSILMGLLRPDAGSVLFGDVELTKLSRTKLNAIRMRMGMVYQNAALISSMNIGENIALPLTELSEKTREEVDSIVDQKLEMVGLLDAKGKLPSELSGGMQKRAGLARALALDPEIILFDEPSAGLDPINSQLIDELIIKLRDQQNVTSIVVTHEMKSAFAVATRMAFLHDGKILLEGSAEQFKNSEYPEVVAFLGSYSAHTQAKA